jgi:vacuolar-type H+-ATPase subunit E/Vma4
VSDGHVERLLVELEERANAEIAQVEEEARVRVAAIATSAAAAAERITQLALRACEADEARRRAVEVAGAQRASRGALLVAQHAFVDRVMARTHDIVRERLASIDDQAISTRVAQLRRYAMTTDVRVDQDDEGITLAADGGHLTIADDITSWLARDRAIVAIEACRAVENSP